jgi:hypothetical protein
MRNIANIPLDVILLICEQLHTTKPSDVLAVALVCRSWNEPGLDVLWSSFMVPCQSLVSESFRLALRDDIAVSAPVTVVHCDP